MQTFLPFPSFSDSAHILDRQRLGKQRVEAFQIYNALTNPSYGWQNHPAVNMWRGHEWALCTYGAVCCVEWKIRGYQDSLLAKFADAMNGFVTRGVEYHEPAWLGDRRVHLSHQSKLVQKMPEHYGQFVGNEFDQFDVLAKHWEYFWPVR